MFFSKKTRTQVPGHVYVLCHSGSRTSFLRMLKKFSLLLADPDYDKFRHEKKSSTVLLYSPKVQYQCEVCFIIRRTVFTIVFVWNRG